MIGLPRIIPDFRILHNFQYTTDYSDGAYYGYAYDAVGNRVAYTDTLGEVTTYVYDAADRIVSRADSETPPTSYSWNDRGDLLSDGFQSYTWDAAGRLSRVDGGGGLVVEYGYDGANNRVSSEVDGATTSYVVDPLSSVDQVPQVLVEQTGSNSTRYLYGLDLLGQIQGGTPVYLGYDALSVRLHVNNSGEIEATYRYGPFGEAVGEGVSGYGFTGERFDAFSGLLYLRARYYAPAVGRFVSRDTWPGKVDFPGTLTRFVYVTNNPLNFLDPTGLQCGCIGYRDCPCSDVNLWINPYKDSCDSAIYLPINRSCASPNPIQSGPDYMLPIVPSWPFPYEVARPFGSWDQEALDSLLQDVLVEARNLIGRDVDWDSTDCVDITDPTVPLACIDVPVLAAIRAGADIRVGMEAHYNAAPNLYRSGQNPSDCFFTRRIKNVVNYLEHMGLYQDVQDPNPRFSVKPGMIIVFDVLAPIYTTGLRAGQPLSNGVPFIPVTLGEIYHPAVGLSQSHSGIVADVTNGKPTSFICAVGTDPETGTVYPSGYKVVQLERLPQSWNVDGWGYFPVLDH